MERRIQDKLMQLTADETAEVRAAAATAFGEAGVKTRNISDALLRMTEDDSASVRVAAVIALGRISKS